jgi:hypothetical protein
MTKKEKLVNAIKSMSKEDLAKSFGISVDQLEKQYAKNYEGIRRLYEKAKKTNRKVNGFTKEQLAQMAEKYKKLAGKYAR